MSVMPTLLAGAGSAVGAVARYSVGRWIARVNQSQYPWGTWIVNMLGTWLLGVLVYQFSVAHQDPNLLLLLGTGFCGGFTTFSTMSVEAVQLFKTRKILGVLYLCTSLAIGLLLSWITQFWL